MGHVIDIIAKGLLAASLAVLGLVAVTPPPVLPPPPQFEIASPADFWTPPVNSSHLTIPTRLERDTENLKRLEVLIKEQRAQTERISGKLDLLLGPKEGRDAKRQPTR